MKYIMEYLNLSTRKSYFMGRLPAELSRLVVLKYLVFTNQIFEGSDDVFKGTDDCRV